MSEVRNSRNGYVRKVFKSVFSLYRTHRLLWDPSHHLYNNKTERMRAYKIILEKLREVNPDASVYDVKLKLGHLRTAYKREHKKVIQSRINDEDPPYVPTLWYYNDLTFLDDDTERPTSSSVEVTYLETDSDEEDGEENNTTDNETSEAVSYITGNLSTPTTMSGNVDTAKSILTEFIQAYKAERLIWDTKHALHSNQIERKNAFSRILAVYKNIDPDATIIDVKRKIKNMRGGYDRERKKVLKSFVSDMEVAYKPSLWYYEHFTFLHKDPDQAEAMEEYYLEEEDTDAESHIDDSEPKLETSGVFLNQSEATIDISQSGSVSSESRSFGATVGMQLEEMEATQRVIAEKLISDVTFRGRMNLLTADTRVLNSR